MKMSTKTTFNNYLHFYPEEISKLSLLAQLIESGNDIFSRKNFAGHITASAFVVNESSRQVLLLEHKALKKLLQPGGHIDSDDKNPIAAAIREVEEETGLKLQDLTYHPAVPGSDQIPFDIDTHEIPENKKKGEPFHYHHDFRFVFTTNKSDVAHDPLESNNFKWIDWEDFRECPNFKKIAAKIEKIFNPNTEFFFRSLTSYNSKKISVIAVSHIIPSSEEYINALKQNFNLVGIVPKPKSINKNSQRRIESAGVKILYEFNRETILENPNKFIELLKNEQKVCLVDIGGYFSSITSELKNQLGDKFIGIVEDTENGHQKYEKNPFNDLVLVSVARSPLKNYEDQLVGHGVAHATETVLRQINVLMSYRSCGLIGYGKIGRGIAEYLHQRNIRPRVSDVNPLRSIQASCDGAYVCSTTEVIRKSDIVFCATGAQAIDLVNIGELKSGSYIASATSSDDEFNFEDIDNEYKKEIIDPHITRYYKRGHEFYLLNDGNAINFLFSAAVDNYINLVQGELIYTIGRMADRKPSKKIQTNSETDHTLVAQSWLNFIKRR
jgi:S-adenosylhomocysteine hydrolase/8-oxo-dGTP pyrophosphatase MutT (NUDIX family)